MEAISVNEPAQGGLSHLMEAATALAKLTDEPSPESTAVGPIGTATLQPQPTRVQPRNVISDEEVDASRAIRNNKEIFPERLMAILNDESLTDIISWLPHGRSFVIIRPDVFTSEVLPKYLPPLDSRTSTKYASFTRKLNRWGFRQATRGPDTGAFHHPLFRRDQPALCLDMVCQRSRDRKPRKNLPAKKRKVAQLTKESLDAMNSMELKQTPSMSKPQMPRQVALVSEDSQSMRSSLSENNSAYAQQQGLDANPTQGITMDAALAKRAIEQRNHEERMRVAKAMLYHAYLRAVQGNNGV